MLEKKNVFKLCLRHCRRRHRHRHMRNSNPFSSSVLYCVFISSPFGRKTGPTEARVIRWLKHLLSPSFSGKKNNPFFFLTSRSYTTLLLTRRTPNINRYKKTEATLGRKRAKKKCLKRVAHFRVKGGWPPNPFFLHFLFYYSTNQ